MPSTSLVIELQRLASDGATTITELLRKALVVASKLKIDDFKVWIRNELGGYTQQPTPEYRKVVGQLITSDRFGEQELRFQSTDIENMCSCHEVDHSISEIEKLSSTSGQLSIMLSANRRNILVDLFKKPDLSPRLKITQSSLHAILDGVRNVVLEWSLQLEQEGIMGEGMTFTAAEKERAAQSQSIHIENFNGVLGNVSGTNVQVGDYGQVHQQLKDAGISRDQRNGLEDILDAMKAAKPSDKALWAQKGMDWLRDNAGNIGSTADAIHSWFTPHLPTDAA